MQSQTEARTQFMSVVALLDGDNFQDTKEENLTKAAHIQLFMDGKKSQMCTTDITIYLPEKQAVVSANSDDISLGKMFTIETGEPFVMPPPTKEIVLHHILLGKYVDVKFYFFQKNGQSILDLTTIGIYKRK